MNDSIEDAAVLDAARHIRGHPQSPLCFVSHPLQAGRLRRQLSSFGVLPRIISLPNFFQAAAALPRAPVDKIILAAALADPPPADDLTLSVYDALPATMQKNAPAAMRFAAEAARLLAELFECNLDREAEINAAFCDHAERREIAVIAALWDIFHPVLRRRQQHLRRLARKIKQPVVAVGDGDDSFNNIETDFLRHCAQGCVFFHPSVGPLEQQLLDCLSTDKTPPPLPSFVCGEGAPAHLGDAAQLALQWIQQRAAENKSVGIVVYDRLLARRVRALAETRGILIKDNSGWRADTLSFGAALRLFLDAAAEHRPSLAEQLIAPPFWGEQPRQTEQSWRKKLGDDLTPPKNWGDYNDVLSSFSDTGAARLAALPQWVEWLLTASQPCLTAWKDDIVGDELRRRLRRRSQSGGAAKLSLAAFAVWLEMFLHNETFGERSIDSPLEYIAPADAHRRRYDSLLLLGANADTLPGAPAPFKFLNETMKKLFNLPDRRARIQRQKTRFCRLLAAHPAVSAIWRGCGDNGEEVLPSPFWRLFIDAAGAPETLNLSVNLSPADLSPPSPAMMTMRRPPSEFFVTDGGYLMQCPYLFFIRGCLHLSEYDAGEDMSPGLQGRLLHRTLKRFGETSRGETAPEALRRHWRCAVEKVLQKSDRADVGLLRAYWLSAAERFLDQETRWRQTGWRTVEMEESLAVEWSLGGRAVVLKGRVDRIDDKGGEKQIIDFKSGRQRISPRQLQNGEDPQLPLYAAMRGFAQAECRIVQPLIADGAVDTQNQTPPLRVAARLRRVLRQIVAGVAMPANGATQDCVRCESRRICRRDHWREI